MKITDCGRDLKITDVKDFDIEQTLECGQCFHFNMIDDHDYAISAYGRLLHVAQDENSVVLYDTDETDFFEIWNTYFDLGRDYAAIKEHLLKYDDKLSEAISAMGGVRILNQEFFETLMSFIISQNKQIPHIKQIVAAISAKYGKYLGTIAGTDYYSFPDCHTLHENACEEAFRECKTGFRAPYLWDAVENVCSGNVSEERLRNAEITDCLNELMTIKGVGSKVASCVALFSLGKTAAFPVDVWIKRMMEQMYYDGKDTPKKTIEEFAVNHFGEYGGYAQQYIFYYGRDLKMKK
ncbi:MAG: DNA glycosylase [Clostridia bacterium]|nr:DNA glycosylase [Clostridia bacterium]